MTGIAAAARIHQSHAPSLTVMSVFAQAEVLSRKCACLYMFRQDCCLGRCGAGVSSVYLDLRVALVVCELLFVVQGHDSAG